MGRTRIAIKNLVKGERGKGLQEGDGFLLGKRFQDRKIGIIFDIDHMDSLDICRGLFECVGRAASGKRREQEKKDGPKDPFFMRSFSFQTGIFLAPEGYEAGVIFSPMGQTSPLIVRV